MLAVRAGGLVGARCGGVEWMKMGRGEDGKDDDGDAEAVLISHRTRHSANGYGDGCQLRRGRSRRMGWCLTSTPISDSASVSGVS